MTQELKRQRIKSLIEHGGYADQQEPLNRRLIAYGVIAALLSFAAGACLL